MLNTINILCSRHFFLPGFLTTIVIIQVEKKKKIRIKTSNKNCMFLSFSRDDDDDYRIISQSACNTKDFEQEKRWRSEDNAIGYRVRDQGERRARLDNRQTPPPFPKKKMDPDWRLVMKKKKKKKRGKMCMLFKLKCGCVSRKKNSFTTRA